MKLSWQETQQRLDRAAAILNHGGPVKAQGPFRVGIDLGTADVVLMALDHNGWPAACFLEWARVVRDGVVTDYVGALDIVRRLIARAEQRLGAGITQASTSFPPGTDRRLSTNILETAGLEVLKVEDEPTCVASLLRLDRAAVVDVGGGTTGTAVVQNGEVVYSGDEPTGGTHISLVIAGHFGIGFEEAEKRKRAKHGRGILDLAKPTLQRISDIVAGHIRGHAVDRLILTGGTCCLPGVERVFEQELGIQAKMPSQPLLLTPLAIASLCLD